MAVSIEGLPNKEQQYWQEVFRGEKIPPLSSDIIAKQVLSPDMHPERLNYYMRSIAKDETIEVDGSRANEGIHLSINSKGMVFDIPSWLKDGGAGDVEIQKAKQDFIFTRTDLYASDTLLLQYTVEEGQSKGDLDYTRVNRVLIIVLMVESPKAFTDYDEKSDKYIHRFTTMTADTGLSYEMKAQTMYVQLDKCLEQFRRGYNGEAEDGKPDLLQKRLAAIADPNDEKVLEAIAEDTMLMDIKDEAIKMVQDREVQEMLIQERLNLMDWTTFGNEQRREGKAEGEDMTSVLFGKLLSSGRTEDAQKAANDKAYRAKLFSEFKMD